ncbi:hypothetical protein [Limnospira indica]|uniref:hypothetical protein n=1 Tax=Limnospira indica TaxID=147322 RepID=UPI001D17CF94|nr:hypothetical protein [Limnospira indica]
MTRVVKNTWARSGRFPDSETINRSKLRYSRSLIFSISIPLAKSRKTNSGFPDRGGDLSEFFRGYPFD